MDVTCQYQQTCRAAYKGKYCACGEKHPTGLHGYKGSKKKKDADGDNSQKTDSTLACAATKLKPKVVSMCVVPVKVKCSNS